MGRPKDERGISGRANIFIAGGEGGKKGVEVDSAAAEVVPLFALYLGGVGSPASRRSVVLFILASDFQRLKMPPH